MSERDEATRLLVPASAPTAMTVPASRPSTSGPTTLGACSSPLWSYLEIVRRRGRVLALTAGAVFAAACLLSLMSPRVYEATATMLVSQAMPQAASDTGAADQVQSMMAAMATSDIETHAALVVGRSTAVAAADRLKASGGPNLSASQVQGALHVSIVPKTRLLHLSARAHSGEEARRVANAAASAYVDLNRRRAQGSSESASRYLSQQLEIAKGNLTRSEEALRAFKESTGAVASDASAGDLLARAATLRKDVDGTAADLAQVQERLEETRRQLARQDRRIQSARVRDNTVVQQLCARLVDLEGQRLLLQSQYTEALSAPVKQAEEEIRITRDQLDAEIRNVVGAGGDLTMQQTLVSQLIQGEAEIAALGARQRQLRTELSHAQAELNQMPARQITLARLQRQVEVAQGIHSDLLRRAQEMEVGRVMALGNTDVVELAEAPLLPIKPNVPVNLALGLLLGLSVGIGLVMLQEQMDDTISDEADAARLLDAPVLAVVPAFELHSASGGIAALTLDGRVTDAYAGLRVNLGFVAPGGHGRVVLVTSAEPSEGKTTTALNLAVVAAQSGRRVVLIDGDMRHSAVHRVMGLTHAGGLSNLLVGQIDLSQARRTFEGSGLSVIGSGTPPPNPADLLDSDEMRRLVARLRTEVDLVVLDSPPLMGAPDTLVMAGLCDAMLMVCVPGETGTRSLHRSRILLDQIGRRISGVVLNKVPAARHYGYYHSYY